MYESILTADQIRTLCLRTEDYKNMETYAYDCYSFYVIDSKSIVFIIFK